MKKNSLILALFIGLTILLTYPLVIHMREAVEEPGDSLFVTWTIAWDIKALLSNPSNIFHANIFYPYKYTLAYSEHMIGVGLLALPIYLFVKNILFTYNFMLLLSFILCGWGAYLLVYQLTKDVLAGIVSGIIFAFCPFRFDQLGHLHVLTCQWMPFALLFLHKIADNKTKKISLNIYFGFFLFFQFISSGHNGLYLMLVVVLFLLYYRNYIGISPWITVAIVIILLIPFYYPYFYLAKEFGFQRQAYEFKLYSPQLISYLAVPEGNWLYGKVLSKYCRPEAVMFPGLIAIILAFWRKLPKIKVNRSKYVHKWVNRIINVFIIIDVMTIVAVIVTGGFNLGRSIFGIQLKISDFARPVYVLLILYGLKSAVNWNVAKNSIQDNIKRIISNTSPVQFYWILAIAAFLLSFGPMIRAMDKDVIWGPYSLLYNFVPGFKGIRAAGRIYTLFILAIAVLAGFGIKKIRETKNAKVRYLSWIIPFFVLIEYINLPFPLNCWIGTKPPPIYQWLKNQQGEFAILELPMPNWYDKLPHEIECMYWSIYHDKKIVNGYSGYSPPSYWPMSEKMKDFPDEDTMDIVKAFNVKYVIVHEGDIRSWGFPSVIEKMSKYKDLFSLKFNEGGNYAYELLDNTITSSIKPKSVPVSKGDWNIVTNYNSDLIKNAIDNDPASRWHTKTTQIPGMFIELDLGKIQKTEMVSMTFGKAINDYPRGIQLEISNDGKHWKEIPLNYIYANYVKHLLKYPRDNRMILSFDSQDARYIKLIQTGRHDSLFWSIYELDVS